MADNFFATAASTRSKDGLDSARFLLEIVDALSDAGHLASFESAAGAETKRERELATLHFYAYAAGVFGARQMAALLETDSGFQAIRSGGALSHDQLLSYRDGANERLALIFTELIIALVDCGLTTFGHTPFHAVVDAPTRTDGARAAAELAVALLNAAKRRDEIENARYGSTRRGDELPEELYQPEERNHRVQAMLRLRSAEASGSTWDEPTKLIDLGSLDANLELPSAGPVRLHKDQVKTATNEATRSGLLPRQKSASVPAVGARAEWNPNIGLSEAGGTIPDPDVARVQAAADGRALPPRLEPSLAPPTPVPPRPAQSPLVPPPHTGAPVGADPPIAPASPRVPKSEKSEASAPPPRPEVRRSQTAPVNRAKGKRKSSLAVVAMNHWQKIIVLLIALVIAAFVLTIQKM